MPAPRTTGHRGHPIVRSKGGDLVVLLRRARIRARPPVRKDGQSGLERTGLCAQTWNKCGTSEITQRATRTLTCTFASRKRNDHLIMSPLVADHFQSCDLLPNPSPLI